MVKANNVAVRNNGIKTHDGNSGIMFVPIISMGFVLLQTFSAYATYYLHLLLML
jgi:hypothetical protein